MKQKILVKVTMNDDKYRTKALKIATGLPGVESASLIGDDNSQIEITGNGVDVVNLTSMLRKSLGYAELVNVWESIQEVASRRLEGIFLVINILTELLSVAFDHLSSTNKHRYALIAMLMSCVAAIMCITELAYKAGKERVVWRWESRLPWFYHSSPNHRPFGTVPEIVGLVCAIVQTISSAVAYMLYLQHINYSFNASLLPLVLALGVFCSKFMQKTNLEVPSERSDDIKLNEDLV